jgi:site-specific recombinase XerD
MNRTRTVLRLLIGYLTLSGTLRQDPSRLARNARSDRPLPTPMSAAEERRFVRALDCDLRCREGCRDQALFTLLLRSGMRLAAALALDVDAWTCARGRHAPSASMRTCRTWCCPGTW